MVYFIKNLYCTVHHTIIMSYSYTLINIQYNSSTGTEQCKLKSFFNSIINVTVLTLVYQLTLTLNTPTVSGKTGRVGGV